jgi:hypothetical protein
LVRPREREGRFLTEDRLGLLGLRTEDLVRGLDLLTLLDR